MKICKFDACCVLWSNNDLLKYFFSSRRRNPCKRRGCSVCANRRKLEAWNQWDKLDEALEVKVTDKGRSVFAKRSFELGEIVAEYKGELISPEQFKDKAREAESSGNCFFFEFLFRGKKYAIDARQEDETKGRLINHSKKLPNVKPIVDSNLKKGMPVLFFKAICRVAKGTEVLYDYQERRKPVIEKYPWLREWINFVFSRTYIIPVSIWFPRHPNPTIQHSSYIITDTYQLSAWFVEINGCLQQVKTGVWPSN